MPTEITKAHRRAIGQDDSGNDQIIPLTDTHKAQKVKLYALDTETVPNRDVEVASDAQGRLKSSGTLTAHVDEVETKLDTVIGHIDTLESKLDSILAAKADELSDYKIAAKDTPNPGGIDYFGFVKKDGAWYIMKVDMSGAYHVHTYAKGASGFDFSNRASESYASFDSTF